MRALALLLVVALVAGCATVPAGPRVAGLPGRGKSLEQVQEDDRAGRPWARHAAGPDPGAPPRPRGRGAGGPPRPPGAPPRPPHRRECAERREEPRAIR